MKPDLEDFDDLNEPEEGPRGRAMSWVVLAVAVLGFASLAYYAYHSGSKAAQDGQMPSIAADSGPMKTAPEHPGGEEFPNKDKTIYDVIDAENPQAMSAKGPEKLLPEPETPLARVSTDRDDDVDGESPQAQAEALAATRSEPASQQLSPAVVQPQATTFVNKSLAVASEDAMPAGRNGAMPALAANATQAPTLVNEKPTLSTKSASKSAVAKTQTQPATAAATKPLNAGTAYQVQLGAYASEAEAQGAWKKISAAHAGVLSGSPRIVRAEVNGKTYYRLRSGSYASAADAKALCAQLGGQACIAVR